MLSIIIVMAIGIIVGRMSRNRKISRLDNVTMLTIWLLLFLLGVEAGSDERVIKGIASLGLEALAISVSGIAGCSVLALLLWKFTRNRNKPDER